MRAKPNAPGSQQDRFATYMESLAQAAGHIDREEPIKAYCKRLLLPGEHKSVELMVARLAPDNVRQTHQSLHHIVADSPWEDEVLLVACGRSHITSQTATSRGRELGKNPPDTGSTALKLLIRRRNRLGASPQ